MKRILVAIAVTCLGAGAGAGADEAVPDPEAWYSNAYAPLWADQPGEHIGQMLEFYADTIETHTADGEVYQSEKTEWLAGSIEGWLAEGWLTSELQDLKMDRINATTASFKASWLDRYENYPEELSCGWYLADFLEGAWTFTVYADIDCEAHGF